MPLELSSNPFSLEQAIARNPLIVTPGARVVDAIAAMSDARSQCSLDQVNHGIKTSTLNEAQCSCALVCQDRKLVGIVTERDIVRFSASGEALEDKNIAEVMTHPVITLAEWEFTDIFMAANLLNRHRIRHLPLVNDRQQVVGLLTHESLRHLLQPVDLLQLRLVSEVMHRQVVCASQQEPVLSLAQRMATHRVSCVVIVSTEEAGAQGETTLAPASSGPGARATPPAPQYPLGLVTERDIVQFYALGLDFGAVTAGAVMSCPVFAVQTTDSLWAAHTLMQQRRVSRVVVTETGGELAGIVTQSTLLQAMNPLEICRMVEILGERVNHLEAERLSLLENRNHDLEQQVQQRTAELREQVARERIQREIATRIRASLNLEMTLQTVVDEVRRFLACDRALVYQFTPDWDGTVIAESVAPLWQPIMGYTIADPCFQQDAKILYQQGKKRAVADIYQAGYPDCYIKTLETYQVKANLVVPILVQNQLWGLLLAHQCQAPRLWNSEDLDLLDNIALQVAVAIHQAELYEREQAAMQALQQMNQDLESRIEQRTIDLRNSEVRFRRLFEQSPVGIAVSNLRGQIIRVNASLKTMLGYSEAELLQKSIYHLLAAETSSPADPWIEELQESTLSITSREVQLRSKDHPWVWATITSALIFDTFGRPSDIIHLIEDISQRKRAEADLTRYAQEVEDLYNNAPCGYHSLDAEGQFIKINDTELHWLGYSREEVIGRPMTDFLTPSSQQIFQATYYSSFQQGGRVKDLEIELITRTGEVFPVLLNSTAVIDAQGHYRYSRTTTFDMRDRKQVERELQTLSERLTLALQSADIGLWEWDLHQDQMIWDNRMYELYGMTDTETAVSYQRWLTYIHPEDRVLLDQAPQETIQPRQDFELEFRIVLPDGSIRFIKDHGLIQRNEAGDITRVIGINFDITQRKQVELALQESEEKFRQLAENIDGVFWIRDLIGQILYISPSYETIWQRSIAGLYQNPATWLQALHPDDHDRILAKVRQNIAFDEEYRILLPDGQTRWIRDRGFLVANAQGQVYRITGIAEDISPQKRQEADRQVVEETLRRQINAIEAAIDGIAILFNNTYTYLNRSHLEMFGYQQPEELIGKSWRCLYSPEELSRFEQEVFPVLTENRHWQGEAIAIRKDGSTFTEGLSLTLTEHGELICVCRDITAQKQAAKQLQQTNEQLILSNAELARATRLKDEFLANMSHELRTPLNAILGMTEGLQEEVFGPITTAQGRAIATVERSGKHLLALINDILDLAKIESGTLELQLTPVSVAYLCQSSLTFVRQQAIKKHIYLTTHLPPHLPDLVGDELRLRQVLINLLSNAVKFTPFGGSVQLEVTTQQDAQGNSIQFTVKDTGIGIAPDHLDQLFKPFIQIDSSLTRQHSGTGLGLALVRQLVELHNGKVTVVSRKGQGSCFTVCLPYIQPAASSARPDLGMKAEPTVVDLPLPQPAPPASPVLVPGSRPKSPLVLLAEDNAANIASLSSYLRHRGFRLVVAQNGVEAVALSKTKHPDLIVIDIQMPRLDGLSAIRQIRAYPTTAAVPIIALTAFAMPQDREKCLAAGANDYFTKPVRLKALVDRIYGLLEEVTP